MNDRVYMEEQTCHHTSKYAQNPMVTKLVRLVDISTKAMVVWYDLKLLWIDNIL